uniref:Ribosomal protein S16 n=1 Tax=Medicago sativa TaxID=3879 RepID=A0A8K1ZRW6_MEDSA|nr:ribosomal protein S16 [Medicago sativa]
MLNGSKVYSRKSPVLYYFLKETNKMVMLLPFLRRLKIPQVMLSVFFFLLIQ